MLRWMQLQYLFGTNTVLVALIIALISTVFCGIIFGILFMVLRVVFNARIFSYNESKTMPVTLGVVLTLVVYFGLLPWGLSLLSVNHLPEYKNASTYLTVRHDKYTKFNYKYVSDVGLLDEPYSKGSFRDRDTGKLIKFNNDTSTDNSLFVKVAYTDGPRYLIYTNYVPKRKLTKVETAIRQYKETSTFNVHVYLHDHYNN
jgi:hypothetical protein